MPTTPSAPISGYEVYRLPEFQALCDKLGIAIDLLTVDISLELTIDTFLVKQSYRCKIPPVEKVDTTSMKNVDYRTCALPLEMDSMSPTYQPKSPSGGSGATELEKGYE